MVTDNSTHLRPLLDSIGYRHAFAQKVKRSEVAALLRLAVAYSIATQLYDHTDQHEMHALHLTLLELKEALDALHTPAAMPPHICLWEQTDDGDFVSDCGEYTYRQGPISMGYHTCSCLRPIREVYPA